MNRDMLRIGVPVAIAVAILCAMTRPVHPRTPVADSVQARSDDAARGMATGGVATRGESRPLQALRASRLAGIDVVDGDGRAAGRIEDVVVDVDAGTIAHAVLSFDGVEGVGDARFAVPLRAMRLEPGSASSPRARARVDVTRERLARGRGFEPARVPQWDPSYFEALDALWGVEPLRAASPKPRYMMASEIVGLQVTDVDGADIGEVRDLVMDLARARMHYALIDFDAAWSSSDKTFAFRPDEFSIGDARRTLRVKVGKAALQTAPGIDRDDIESTDLSKPAWIGRISDGGAGDNGRRATRGAA
ncbi:MAG: PRC-barrel domain-containing protein [Lautropia sp.]